MPIYACTCSLIIQTFCCLKGFSFFISVVQLAGRSGLDNGDSIVDEFRDYHLSPKDDLPKYNKETMRSNTFWLRLENFKLPNCEQHFSLLVKVALCASSPPHSNKTAEEIGTENNYLPHVLQDEWRLWMFQPSPNNTTSEDCLFLVSELQIRGGHKDNSKIYFLSISMLNASIQF